jgi:hypothetical protein
MVLNNIARKTVMNIARAILILAASQIITACGSVDNFEWFPSASDTTAPTVSASIAGNAVFTNHTTHVATLPANVIFTASEATTVYYTTNGSTPDTSSLFVNISSSSGVTGPQISVTNTILKFFGIDHSDNKNQSAVQTGTIKSP